LLKKVCITCTRKNQRRNRVGLYSKYSTKDLALIEGNTNILNFLFNFNKKFVNEGVIRFMIRGRTNTLWTPERKARCIGKSESYLCSNCGINATGKLGHILNSCTHNFNEMTTGQNDVCKILAQPLKMFKKKLIDFTNSKGKFR
jgi:hypothetical protein